MDNYVVQRIVELQRAIEKLKVSMALTKTSEYTIEWIRDNLEADASFYAWIVTSLETDVAFYNWFRDALEADASFISSLVNSFSLDSAANNWVINTATYSSESYLTLTRTTNQAFTGGAVTTITWQAVTRNSTPASQFQTPFPFTAPSTSIDIPQSGYYTISLNYTSTVQHTVRVILYVGGTSVSDWAVDGALNARHGATITRYFTSGDTVQVGLIPSVTTTMTVVASGSTSESPILHIVKVNAAG